MDLQSIIQTYKKIIRPKSKEEIQWFATQPSLHKAIENAALARNHVGKRYSHQSRIKKSALLLAKELLLNQAALINECKTFDEILNLIGTTVKPINGIGELYIYDTAFRIGAYLNLFPEKVYLHSGTREGAKNFGLNWKKDALLTSEIPNQLQELEPFEIEDILCIFKSKFPIKSNKHAESLINKRSSCV